jgi:hypothetical protein
MNQLNLIHLTASIATAPGHVHPAEWLLFLVPLAILLGVIGYLVATGRNQTGHLLLAPFGRAATSLRRTGMPAWAVGGILVQVWALLVAGIGFYWDVAWHVDFGRDKELFTPPHIMILVGLLAVSASALVCVILASIERAETGWKVLGLRIPYSAAPMAALGFGATLGFPLDDLWHRTYGIDVTMWSPTHLMMIGGACLAPFAARLMLAEAGPEANATKLGRILRRSTTGAMLLALTAFQLEFDLGVPQWQALYQPVLIALATTIVMVAARVSLGRGAAIVVWINFLIFRSFFALITGPVLGHVVPRFPLYLGIAIVVEVAWIAGRRLPTLYRAMLTGLAVGTLGLATEWAFSHVWGRHPWQPELLGGIWVAVAIAVAGAVVGAAIGDVLRFRRPAFAWQWIALAGVAIVALLAVPAPRNSTPISATVQTQAAGNPYQGFDREGFPSAIQDYTVDVSLNPATAAKGADFLEVVSWQGNTPARNTTLVETGPGHYRSTAPVPAGGSWKTMIYLSNRDVLMALPISMPADPAYGTAAVKPVPQRTAAMVPAHQVLTSEAHAGDPLVANAAYGAFFGMIAIAVGLLALGYFQVSRRAAGEGPTGGSTRRQRRLRLRPASAH